MQGVAIRADVARIRAHFRYILIHKSLNVTQHKKTDAAKNA